MEDIIRRKDRPFCISLAGPRESGKSYLLTNIIKEILPRFKKIHVLSTSLDSNHDYDDFMVDPYKPEHELSAREKRLKEQFVFEKNPSTKLINDIIDEMEEQKCSRVNEERFGAGIELIPKERKGKRWPTKCPQVLIILDDCLDTGLLNRKGIIDTLAERGRHMNVSVIVTTQMYKKLSLNVRNNSEYLFFFSPYSYGELEKYLEDFVPRELLKYARAKFIEVFGDQFNFILISSIHSTDPLKKMRYGKAEDFFKNNLQYILPQDYHVGVEMAVDAKKKTRIRAREEKDAGRAKKKKKISK